MKIKLYRITCQIKIQSYDCTKNNLRWRFMIFQKLRQSKYDMFMLPNISTVIPWYKNHGFWTMYYLQEKAKTI